MSSEASRRSGGPETSPDGGTKERGTAPAAEKPRDELFSEYSWHEAPRPLVTRFWRRSLSLRKIVAPVCRLGKYPLRSPFSHEHPLLLPGHQPLSQSRIEGWIRGVCPPATLVKRGAQLGCAWFEEEKGVLLFFFYLLVPSSMGMALASPPGQNCLLLCQGNWIRMGGIALPEGEATTMGL